MQPTRLTSFIKKYGQTEKYKAGQVFHSQDFPESLFMLKKGYVKRYQINKAGTKVIELIYGPGHMLPLSQLYKILFGIEQNQEDLVYVYQAMTEVELFRINDSAIVAELDKNPLLYADLFYEAGLRLKSNIERLASNAIKDEYKKVAHQLVCLAEEFGKETDYQGKKATKIVVPLEPKDMAEQLNISPEVAEAVLNSLGRSKLIATKGRSIIITDIDMLKDVYL